MKLSKLHSRIDTYQPQQKQHRACYPAAYVHPLVISTPNSHPRACQATTRFFTSAATTRFTSGVATTRVLPEKQGWMPCNARTGILPSHQQRPQALRQVVIHKERMQTSFFFKNKNLKVNAISVVQIHPEQRTALGCLILVDVTV